MHLDVLGGLAGDMFAAALLHAAPDYANDVRRAVEAATGVGCSVVAHDDGTLTGYRFHVPSPHPHHRHDHVHWSDIRSRLTDGRLEGTVAAHAVGIFEVLARAEARVHGTTPDAVVFHEVGAADSIADIVAAATLIVRLGIETASCSALPLGSGRVETAHGIMPVPAPAVSILLEGMETIDDGIAGERITPTGAAILRHLSPRARPAGVMTLQASGYGFGTRTLPGISNCLRAGLFEPAAGTQEGLAVPHRRLAVIAFEIDDQSGEDLATGIERIRGAGCVHDVVQIPVIGKKGRMAVQVQVLADEAGCDEAVALCFRETTTIGLRVAQVDGRALRRRTEVVSVGGQDVRVKIVERPGGVTGKPEADDVGGAGDASARSDRRTVALAAVRTAP